MLGFLKIIDIKVSEPKFINYITNIKYYKIKYIIISLKIIFKILFIFSLIPLIVLTRLIKPFCLIRFGKIDGHATGRSLIKYSFVLQEKKEKNFKSIDLFFISNKKENNFHLLKMIKKNLNINFINEYFFLSNKLFFKSKNHEIVIPSDDLDCYFRKNNFKLKFEESDEKQGDFFIKNLGLEKGDKFVCYLIRDSNYKIQIDKNFDSSYHKFRNSDLHNFESSMLKLADMGYWVFRMGKFTEKRLSVKHEKIIDYANHESRSDFLDLWLMSKCFFCVSTGTGIDMICLVNNVPAVFVNYLPLWSLASFSNTITVPKKLVWKKDGKYLDLNDHIQYTTHFQKDYEKNDILVSELSSNEIEEAILEMEARLTGKWKSKEDENKLQEKFWNILKSHKSNKRPVISVYEQSRIGYEFISKNEDWFLNRTASHSL